jgi:hypothetical protein
MIYRLSTFGDSQISCNVAEIHSVAPATAIFYTKFSEDDSSEALRQIKKYFTFKQIA